MGSGKSTLARALAAEGGLPVWDLDELVASRAGVTVAQLFAERGEVGFRALERQTLRGLMAEQRHGVVALGGGTVTDDALRRELLRLGTLITLRAAPEELARRVDSGEGRPLLAGPDVLGSLQQLLRARAPAYAECHAEIDTQGRDLGQLAREALAVASAGAIVVPLGLRSYRVEVAAGCRFRAKERTAAISGGGPVVLVSDEIVGPVWGAPLAAALRAIGNRLIEVTLPAGEQHKTLRSVERIWDAALTGGVDRGSVVISVCGGVVGDLSGFAASTLLRGLPVGHVPTTLLSMVDSAIGGKTGFDTPHGKNLLGSFHQPGFVLCDVEVLATLPQAERIAGLAEVVKSAWIEGEEAVAGLERDAAALLAGDAAATERAIRMSASMKARIVSEDEREAGARALLNLGHTVGHAIEAALDYRGIRHGEAVALGMVAAFRVACRLGRAQAGDVERVTRLLQAFGLPTDVDTHLHQRTLSFLGSDKKRRAGQITFVLPAGPGEVALQSLPLARLPELLRSAS